MGRASKDKRDIYYRKAKEEGYRARSAYKLLQIHEEFNILDPAEIRTGAVDLCAAPGSWSQVLAHHFKTLAATTASSSSSLSSASPLPPPRVVAVDLQEMAPIEGVYVLQGDITSEATAHEIIRLLNAPEDSLHLTATTATAAVTPAAPAPQDGDQPTSPSSSSKGASPRKADIVICDGAPDVTGMHELDEYLQHHLLLAALHITTFMLRRGGCFVTKMFRGPNTPFLIAKSEVFFDQVRVVKPKSSRNASMESFLLCQGFRLPPGYVPRFLGDATATTHAASAPYHRNEEEEEEGKREEIVVRTDETVQVHAAGPLQASDFTPAAPRYRYAVAAPGAAVATAGGLSAVAASSSSSESRAACTLPGSVLAPFLSCGDLSGFDADMCYDRPADTTVLAPVQPPLQAPYLAAAAAAAAAAAEVKTATTGSDTSMKRLKVEAPP
ncbi:putative FtsJ-like methyltransferase [Leptomonas pyrrhocoris]|uniref:Putative tRNA (cytidine(32)/guanosine(34)-2'-O)-methyltransferase n=1 Tax=Leptomonas pyrrhocoris TaxID=157538 RepID=A0A0N0VD86_LEPPY|nr:putative FtsJ-like methyltransferase [Leptomonas pyrrhocoris]XP_015653371.1 putative FtsJ-like methyltransferase [Leptomonas pyrrhocoris]KPA74931.1 putative FtsJ-like methyltransferase [Leptomonas pyrrhocoris]KPA74932.1 putative FtsJ-like methyltransferase [Leptomonas pyrrhocoris]|eukprot:XP_015653370.1 putative FtsJ-like methyltransferase [Leptomonas pyrrhocoris]